MNYTDLYTTSSAYEQIAPTVGLQSSPTMGFQSVSTMQLSGSEYSSTPMVDAEGYASYNSFETYTTTPSLGPRRISPNTPEGQPTTLAGGLVELLIMAALAAGVIFFRRRKNT